MITVKEEFIELLLALTTNITGIFLLIIIMGYSYQTFSIKNKENRYLYVLFFVSLLEMILHLYTTYAQYYQFFGSNLFGRILYSLVFTLNHAFLIAWILYINDRLGRNAGKNKKQSRLLFLVSLPALINLILSLVNIATPIFFYYENFDYGRLPLYNLNLIVSLGYLILGLIIWVQSKRRRRIYQQLPFAILLLPIVVSRILEYFFIQLCVVPLGNCISLIILVLINVREYSSVDGMTGLYTRRELYQYLDYAVEKKNQKLTGVMLDLDRFKQINDTYGHNVGDDALSDFGYLIRHTIPAQALAYRYGGDEFIILLPGMSEQDAEKMVETFMERMKQFNEKANNVYQLESSYGISQLEKEDNTNTFIERLDQRMYQEKMRRKAQRR